MAGDVDPEVDALFDLPVDAFVAARGALAKARRAAGDREVAAAVKQLRRPTLSAWALNQLARRHPDDVRTLVEQGAALAEAQEQALAGARVDLREAGRARTDTLRRLTRAADAVLGGQGSAAHRDEVVATLTAASSDPASGALLLEGRLSEPLEAPSGFGGPFSLPTADTEQAPASERAGPSPARRKRAKAGGGDRRQEEAPATAGERGRHRREGVAAPAPAATGRPACGTAGPEEAGATGTARERARARPPKDREGAPAPDTAEAAVATDPGVSDAGDAPSAGGPEGRLVEEAAASSAAAEAQADAARAAARADAMAERVAALEEELAEARAALAEAEQEAGRRRRAAAAAAVARADAGGAPDAEG